MPDIQTLHCFRCNLNDGPCEVSLPSPLMHQDSLADVFRVAVHRDHLPVPLTGMTVCGYFLFSSTQQTLLLEGILQEHFVSVTLSADCYTVPGFATLVIQLQDGDVRHTVLKADVLIKRTSTDAVFVPEHHVSLPQLMKRIDALEQHRHLCRCDRPGCRHLAEARGCLHGRRRCGSRRQRRRALPDP